MDSFISLVGFFLIVIVALWIENMYHVNLLDSNLKWKNSLNKKEGHV